MSYSEVIDLAGELKQLSGQVEELTSIIKNEDYTRFGDNGDLWTGDAAEVAHQTFDKLVDRVPNYVNSINEFADYLVKKVEKK